MGRCDLVGEGLAHLGFSRVGADDDWSLLGGGQSIIVENHVVVAEVSLRFRKPTNFRLPKITRESSAIECGIFKYQLLAEVGRPFVIV